MDNSRTNPMRSVFKNIGRANDSYSLAKKSTIERLATPKTKDKRWIPDRPSVYWLDYIIDPTPQKLKEPEELASYYNNFEPRFPRMRDLSTPRPYYGTLYSTDDSLSRPISVTTGIPISALTYTATDRIKELARPKTSMPGNDNFSETSSTRLPPTTTSRQSLSTARSHSPKGKVRYFDPHVDLARGDFPRRSKHAIHTPTNNERERDKSNVANSSNYNLRSRSTSNYHKAGNTVTRDILRNGKKQPMSRTLYSGRN